MGDRLRSHQWLIDLKVDSFFAELTPHPSNFFLHPSFFLRAISFTINPNSLPI